MNLVIKPSRRRSRCNSRWSSKIDAGSWWMVGCKCVIHQRVNYDLDHLYFRGYSQNARTNIWTISKADNNNNYNYDQALGKKYTWQKQHIMFGLEV